jgi:hypothetical protein
MEGERRRRRSRDWPAVLDGAGGMADVADAAVVDAMGHFGRLHLQLGRFVMLADDAAAAVASVAAAAAAAASVAADAAAPCAAAVVAENTAAA